MSARSPTTRRFASAAGWLVVAVALLWPALYNGGPFFFSDTTAYMRGADAGIQKLTGISTSWSAQPGASGMAPHPDGWAHQGPVHDGSADHAPGVDSPARGSATVDSPGVDLPARGSATRGPTHHASSVSSIEDKTVLSGRSVYYGALLYLGHRTGGFWLSVAAQSLAMTACLWLTLRAFGLAAWSRMRWVVVAIVALTPAPFFVSFLMPDIFAGLTILACAALMTAPAPMRAAELGFWFALLALALAFHTTHVLLAAILLVAGACLYAWQRWAGRGRRAAMSDGGRAAVSGRVAWAGRDTGNGGLADTGHPRTTVNGRGLAVITGALIAASAAGAAFSAAVTRIVGEPPLSPPFLMARLIDDGPGYRYLRATCPENGFTVCRFVDRLPAQSDFFLWSTDPARGVFAAADPATRRRLSHEQFRFAVAVFAFDPWRLIDVSVHNALKQASLIGLTEFDYDAQERETLVDKLPADRLPQVMQTAAFRGTMPTRVPALLAYLTAAISLCSIGFMLVSARRTRREPGAAASPPARDDAADAAPLRWFAGFVLLALLANTAVCGMLSGPHDRYEARVVWLLPVAALMLAFGTSRSRRDGSTTRRFVLGRSRLDAEGGSRQDREAAALPRGLPL